MMEGLTLTVKIVKIMTGTLISASVPRAACGFGLVEFKYKRIYLPKD